MTTRRPHRTDLKPSPAAAGGGGSPRRPRPSSSASRPTGRDGPRPGRRPAVRGHPDRQCRDSSPAAGTASSPTRPFPTSPPDDLRRPVSVGAIANPLRMPFETARRRIQALGQERPLITSRRVRAASRQTVVRGQGQFLDQRHPAPRAASSASTLKPSATWACDSRRSRPDRCRLKRKPAARLTNRLIWELHTAWSPTTW